MLNYTIGMQLVESKEWETTSQNVQSLNAELQRNEKGDLKIKRLKKHFKFKQKTDKIKVQCPEIQSWGMKLDYCKNKIMVSTGEEGSYEWDRVYAEQLEQLAKFSFLIQMVVIVVFTL